MQFSRYEVNTVDDKNGAIMNEVCVSAVYMVIEVCGRQTLAGYLILLRVGWHVSMSGLFPRLLLKPGVSRVSASCWISSPTL